MAMVSSTSTGQVRCCPRPPSLHTKGNFESWVSAEGPSFQGMTGRKLPIPSSPTLRTLRDEAEVAIKWLEIVVHLSVKRFSAFSVSPMKMETKPTVPNRTTRDA